MVITPIDRPWCSMAHLVVHWLRDPEGRTLDANQAYAELLRLDLGKIIGKPEDALFPPEMRRRFGEVRDRMQTTHRAQAGLEYIRLDVFGHDMRELAVRGVRSPIFRDGGMVAYSGMAFTLEPIFLKRGNLIHIDTPNWCHRGHGCAECCAMTA